MNLRRVLETLRGQGELTVITKELSPYLETAAVIHALQERPTVFERIRGSRYPVVAGLCSSREAIATALGVGQDQLMATMTQALQNPASPPLITVAPCQEVIEPDVDLCSLPVLTHLRGDGSAYITAGVVIVNDPELGRNVAIHRLMALDERRLAARLVEQRGTDSAWHKSSRTLDVAICIGNSTAVLLAAAMSPAPGTDEMGIAHSLDPTPLVRCRTVDLAVPADCEIVLEGKLGREMVDEGPFLDLTETMDIVRRQPVIEIQCITHRRDGVYQALLPGGLEHKLLMGLPCEPTIYQAVRQVCDCVNVQLTPGGGSWLHALIQIRKRHADDGLRAAEAAFRGHGSLKHVWVVDEDIDILDPSQVEWALATRFQADRSLQVRPNQAGSSLDPSGCHVPGHKSRTAKMIIDATIPWLKADGTERTPQELAAFHKVGYETVDLDKVLPRKVENG